MPKVAVRWLDQSVQQLGYGVDDQRSLVVGTPSVARIFPLIIVSSSMFLYMDKAVGA
jgi:hypothetical protein